MDVTVESAWRACRLALDGAGYRRSTISQYEKGFRMLAEHCGSGVLTREGVESFLGARRPDGGTYDHDYLRFRERVARLATEYAERGTLDLSARRAGAEAALPSSPALRAALADYARDMEARGLARSTRDYYGRLAREFLLHLESGGAASAGEADAGAVLGFMAWARSRWPGTSSYHLASNFRPFLRWLGRDDLARALALASPVRERSTVAVLTDDEGAAVAEACVGGGVAAGDAAMTLLALTCGLRASDIIGIRLGDVDWRADSIRVVQRKTGAPVTVPMVAALARALGTYILSERPDADDDHVFLRRKAPHAPLSDHSAVYAATRRVMSAAGVDGAGTRLLRHSAASRMLRSGSPLPLISAALGHADPASTDVYLETDDATMASCVLALPRAVRA